MLQPEQLHDYQKKAINFQSTHEHSAIWMDCGLGKTAITLSSITHLLNCQYLRAVLIVAPIRVIRMVWRQESKKWSHTQHLTFSAMVGTKDQRTRALLKKADVYLINYENLRWLAETLDTYFIKKGREIPFDGVVWDEITKLKNSSTRRVSAVRKILKHFKWTTGLTGTPASNGYKDLHGQYLVLDGGERLGTSKTAFRERFYYKISQYKDAPYPDTEETIQNLIGDITLQMSADDYNPLPDLITNDVMLDLPTELRTKYESLEKQFFFELDNGKGVEVFNSAALTNKLLQFSNGNIYPISGMPLWEPVHTLKLEALEDIIEEAAGQPVLCSYAYRSDAERIMTHFKKLRPINLTDCKTDKALSTAMVRWKGNECPLMIGHPACVHPNTQVLTEQNGWMRIVDVKNTDRVFDGVEFVEHKGCSYSGYKDVIERFGITMTPDHKLLINDEWVEAQHVRDHRDTREAARFRWKTSTSRESKMFSMWRGHRDASTKRSEAQQRGKGVLLSLCKRQISLYDRNSDMENLARDEESLSEPRDEGRYKKLRRTRDRSLFRVGQFREVLRRYARGILGRSNARTNRCEWSLQQGQLHLGFDVRSAEQQTKQSVCRVSRRKNSFGRIVSAFGIQQDDVDHEIEPRDDGRRSSKGLSEVELREGHEACKRETKGKKAHVYDLVDCGPRHRFVIRNDQGEMFISHNSMGHGVDGLQDNGHILVWYGLNWSLDLYDQFNARLRRQGQGAPVVCHRLLMDRTLDLAQREALESKSTTETSLRKAIKHYRESKGY